MYGETKKDLVEIIKKLCEMKQVNLIDGRVCKDHIHMYVAIPPKMSVSEFMSYLKGKSTLMLFDRHPEYRTKWGDRHFWARSYNELCRKCQYECKQSFRAVMIDCPRYLSKRAKRRTPSNEL